jgi:hypothetical protein
MLSGGCGAQCCYYFNDLLLNFETTQQSITDLKALGLVKTGEYGDYDFLA